MKTTVLETIKSPVVSSFKISVTLPTSWRELSQQQLHEFYAYLANGMSSASAIIYCFFRWAGVLVTGEADGRYFLKKDKQHGLISVEEVAAATSVLDFLKTPSSYPVHLDEIDDCTACEVTLQGVDFQRYLYCDNLYQGFLASNNYELLKDMARTLYTGAKRVATSEAISVFYWWCSLKLLFSRQFPYLFKAGSADAGSPSAKELQEAMNAQIRALTKGDITKEKEILLSDTWRALTELDQLAKEYDEFNKKYPAK